MLWIMERVIRLRSESFTVLVFHILEVLIVLLEVVVIANNNN